MDEVYNISLTEKFITHEKLAFESIENVDEPKKKDDTLSLSTRRIDLHDCADNVLPAGLQSSESPAQCGK